MKKLRRSGRLPYGWVSDMTRRGDHTPTYRDPANFLRSAVEAEAMPVGILRDLLRSNIEKLLPARALAVAEAEEESARDYFERMAAVLGRIAP
jgi:hypothetical protein